MNEDYVEYTVRITLKELKDKSTKEQLEWFEERFGECGWVNIAECYGGGGHPKASGFEINNDIKKRILHEIFIIGLKNREERSIK